MTKAAKIRSGAESLSVSEAAAALGISTPTLKRMVAEDRLDSFRTPGGHLRITMESIKDMREQRHARPRPMREASPVLQNRRERLEELTLEAQEHRARRELEKLRREEQEEAETLEAEAQAREDEAAERQAELEVERERLELEKAQEEARQEHERAQERQKLQAAREADSLSLPMGGKGERGCHSLPVPMAFSDPTQGNARRVGSRNSQAPARRRSPHGRHYCPHP